MRVRVRECMFAFGALNCVFYCVEIYFQQDKTKSVVDIRYMGCDL